MILESITLNVNSPSIISAQELTTELTNTLNRVVFFQLKPGSWNLNTYSIEVQLLEDDSVETTLAIIAGIVERYEKVSVPILDMPLNDEGGERSRLLHRMRSREPGAREYPCDDCGKPAV